MAPSCGDVLKCGCFGKRKKGNSEATERVVHISELSHNEHEHYANNFTRTTKYTPITYFPKSLFEQVRQ